MLAKLREWWWVPLAFVAAAVALSLVILRLVAELQAIGRAM